jgi:phage terminase large subunit-like protein
VIEVLGGTTAGYYLLEVVRERLDFPSLKGRVVGKASWWRPDTVLVEDAASGQSLIQTLRNETTLPLPLVSRKATRKAPPVPSARYSNPAVCSCLNQHPGWPTI